MIAQGSKLSDITMQKPVFHICKSNTASGSRLAYQLTLATSQEVFSVDISKSWILAGISPSLIKLILDLRPKIFVFHQFNLLPGLSLAVILSWVLRKNHSFVYDLHDLIPPLRWNRSTLYWLYLSLLEKFVSAIRCRWITVSMYHVRYIEKKYRVKPYLVHNLSSTQSANHNVDTSMGERLPLPQIINFVYFGQIHEERLQISDIEKISRNGHRFSIHGIWTSNQSSWRENMIQLIEKSGGKVNGKYLPREMSFLHNYHALIFGAETEVQLNVCPNIIGSLPNKLFQALSAGLICFLPGCMVEAMRLFKPTGYVYSLDELDMFLADLHFGTTKKAPDSHLLSHILCDLHSRDRLAYADLLSSTF